MIRRFLYNIVLVGALITFFEVGMAEPSVLVDTADELAPSLVHLTISKYAYDQYRPWKHLDIRETTGYGCAVGGRLVLTTAANAADASLIKVRVHGQNNFIIGQVKIIDYQVNLCLIELDGQQLERDLQPITFVNAYRKGEPVEYYWLRSDGEPFSGRGYVDRADMIASPISFEKRLNLIAANISQDAGQGELFLMEKKPIGMGCSLWSKDKEAGLIPAETILAFLEEVQNNPYRGFGSVGFETVKLLDPVQRTYLKLPSDITAGVLVDHVYSLGTGSDLLAAGDVLISIDDQLIDAHGKFKHPVFQKQSFDYLITGKLTDKDIAFTVWRNSQIETLKTAVKKFLSADMLVPYSEYGKQPEYVITAGFILQKLTRPYMQQRGDQWYDKISPHLFHYYCDQAFNPANDRRDIVVLSYVLPMDINQGYQQLQQIVLKSFNGIPITSINDILKAKQLHPQALYHTLEFENDNPIVVIPRQELESLDQMIAQRYGVTHLVHIEP